MPLLFTNNAWSQVCSEELIKGNVAKLKDGEDETVLDSFAKALIACKSEAVKPLIASLQDENSNQNSIASALSELGILDRKVIPLLIEVLRDKNS